MINGILKSYNDYVTNNFIKYDKKQVNLLKELNKTWVDSNRIQLFSKVKKYNGIYVYGSVGIGKTFLLNLFIKDIKDTQKIHFNHFMINLHTFINGNNKENGLEVYIKKFSKNSKILFIDELHIFNIVDALLIKKIFILFKKYKIFILTSSNFIPSDLYKNGLQRNDFLPFIKFLEDYFKIINLDDIRDYRREMLNQSKTYFTPINEETSFEFNKLFDRFVEKSQIHIKKVRTKSRDIRFEKCTSNIAFSSFKSLCDSNLAHEDYHNIAKTFKLIFISNVPFFDDSTSDQCRRFISLIDMLYVQKCSVVILAEKSINNLFYIKSLNKEFARTASRFYEMTIINSKKKKKKSFYIFSSILLFIFLLYFSIGFYLANNILKIEPNCGLHEGSLPNTWSTYVDHEDYSILEKSQLRKNFPYKKYYLDNWQQVYFSSRDKNIKISGWFFNYFNNRPVVIVVHGLFPNGKCKPESNLIASLLIDNKINVLTIDLRNYGDSSTVSKYENLGLSEYKDVLGAFDFLHHHGFKKNQIGLMGISLGGTSVIFAAEEEKNIKAVWLDSSLAEFKLILKDEIARYGFPHDFGLAVSFAGKILTGIDPVKLSPAYSLTKHTSYFFTHGDKDLRVLPHHFSFFKEYSKINKIDAKFWLAKNSYHVDAMFKYPNEYGLKMKHFFESNLK